ncbi:CoA transferase [Microbacterium sp. MC2]
MVDGVASLLQLVWSLRGVGRWADERGANLLDGGAPFYSTYACADGGWVAVGALEPEFFRTLVHTLGWPDAAEVASAQHDTAGWPALRQRLADTFAQRPRDAWAELFAGVDACVTPVLGLDEVAAHPHVAARGTMIESDGVVQAAPAPRFSRTPAGRVQPPRSELDDPAAVLRDWTR